MKKQKRNNANGITLIALVISIIVMLILAGVSINALVGDNGVLTQTQYASFLNEMAAVEEAVQLWKTGKVIEANGADTTAIPTSGMCSSATLEGTERLTSEIGYYRAWSISGTRPANDILSSSFADNFHYELVAYPAGVQDLYYLNNEALDIKGDKVYLIDAATGLIYSVKGIGLKGVRCYSSNMAKAVMSGDTTAPLFAAAEVSGTGSGEKLAGSKATEYVDADGKPLYKGLDGKFYYEDGTLYTGTPVKNDQYNANGFQIISDSNNNNLYKLYNNGDLYAKGIKGNLLNTSTTVMNNINPSEWRTLEIPSEIGGYKQIIPGDNCVYVIDNNDYLWAYGTNSSNKFGLSKEQQIEYTGRDPVKLNVDGKKVKKVLSSGSNTYAVTMDNMLYASGLNDYGNLGVGTTTNTTCFMKCIGIDHPENLISIQSNSNITQANLYVCIDETNNENYKIYYSGKNDVNQFAGDEVGETFLEIKRVYDGNIGKDIDHTIKKIKFVGRMITILTKDEKLIIPSDFRSQMSGEIILPGGKYQEYLPSTFGETDPIQVKDIYGGINYYMTIFKIKNSANKTRYFICSYDNNWLGVEGSANGAFYDFTSDIPAELLATEDAIKQIYIASGNIFILQKNGKVWASGPYGGLGLGTDVLVNPAGFICLQDQTRTLDHPFPNVKDCYYHNNYFTALPLSNMFWEGTDGKIYITGNNTLMFRNNILEQSWTKIASNVKKFNAGTSANSLAYIDFDNNAWVLGDRSDFLGIETVPMYSITNFVKLTEKVDSETKTAFEKNVKDIQIRSGATYILTLNGGLYVSGQTATTSWNRNFYIGVPYQDEEDNITEIQKKFKKIKDNVVLMCAHNMSTFIITRTEVEGEDDLYQMYACGCNDGGVLGQVGSTQTLSEVTGLDFDINSIKKIYTLQRISYVITNDGKLYTCGQNTTNGYGVNGTGHYVSRLFEEIPESAFNNERVKDIVFSNSASSSTIVLTEEGNLYCWGVKSTLGIGTESTDYIMTPQKIDTMSNVDSITGGAGYFVCIKKDGSVWGTGSNTYGILGRWVGIDRNSPNSRYKTAFEWVECPELEI